MLGVGKTHQNPMMKVVTNFTQAFEKFRLKVAPPQLSLIEMLSGYWVTAAISTAANLNIAEALADGPKSAHDLSKELSLSQPSLERLLDALTSVGVFNETDDGAYTLSPMGECLREDSPTSLKSFALLAGRPSRWMAWTNLAHSVRSGNSSFRDMSRQSYFDYLRTHPDEGAVFQKAMAALSSQAAPSLVSSYDFSAFRRIVDIGGGSGAFLIAILDKYPSATGLCFDVDDVILEAVNNVFDEGLLERLEFAGGNFFHTVPIGGDLYILKNVLHDWNNEEAKKILSNIRRSIDPIGKLLIIEAIISDGDEDAFAHFMDLEMLVLTEGGHERRSEDFLLLLKETGFALKHVYETALPFSILEATPC